VRRWIALGRAAAYALFAVAAVVLGSGFGSAALSLPPGGKIGTMMLVRGTSVQADGKFFDSCNPVILKPGPVHRTCVVPRVHRLFIGYGDFFLTKRALDRAWKQLKWKLWVDSHAVNLPAFGTDDRTLYAFPAAGGKDVILREWRVILVGVTPGKHTIRYWSTSPSLGTSDATWTFGVPK
jgi:hypothetical protein